MTPDNISKFADHAHVIIPLNEALRNDARKIRLTAAAVGAERTAAPKANVEADQTIQCGEQRPLIETSSCKTPSGSWRQFNPFGQARGWSRMRHLCEIVDRLQAKGVALRILNMNLDTNNATGKLMPGGPPQGLIDPIFYINLL